MNRTKIEWAQNPDGTPGYTWNPITGCLKGCEYCYARKLANGRLKSRMLANYNIADKGFSMIGGKPCTLAGMGYLYEKQFADPFYPRIWPDRVNDDVRVEAAAIHRSRGVFVCSLGDLFGMGIPADWTAWILEFIRVHPFWRFYLLTKQPQNLAKWSPFPDNCWVGVSVTNGKMLDDAGYYLEQVQAKVKYISFEPLLERIVPYFGKPGINWVIIGAQTKPTILPKVEWVREIADVADQSGVPMFLKDSLKATRGPLKIQMSDSQYEQHYGLRFRQEMPA